MDTKKTNRANIEKWRSSFFLFGMALSLALVWMAFESKTNDVSNATNLVDKGTAMLIEEDIPITHPEAPIVKPILEAFQFEVVENIPDELPEYDFSSEYDFYSEIEEYAYEEAPEAMDKEVIIQLFELKEHPEFLGGEGALVDYLQSNLTYPLIARELHHEGIVYVGFVVEKDGSISTCSILRGVSEECDNEALRVVSEMPKWKAGKQRDKKVRVAFTLPISFKLK